MSDLLANVALATPIFTLLASAALVHTLNLRLGALIAWGEAAAQRLDAEGLETLRTRMRTLRRSIALLYFGVICAAFASIGSGVCVLFRIQGHAWVMAMVLVTMICVVMASALAIAESRLWVEQAEDLLPK